MQLDDMARQLEPEVERLLARHQSTAVEWFPHEYVPWGRARDFVSREEWWDPEDHSESAARSALYVNLLTEDNLPYYFRTLSDFGRDGVWGEWTRRWTAEEGRHAIVIRDYLMVTRAVDPVSLERGRMQQVSTGVTPQPATLCDALCYTSLQELATRIAHRNTGNLLEDPAGRAIMARVSADENLHFLFYRDLASTAIELDPSSMVVAMERTVRGFTMPGTGIPDYARHAPAHRRGGRVRLHDLPGARPAAGAAEPVAPARARRPRRRRRERARPARPLPRPPGEGGGPAQPVARRHRAVTTRAPVDAPVGSFSRAG